MEKTIGTYEDLTHDQIIYLIYSSEGNHRINRYKSGDERVTTVFEWEGFDWSPDTLITGIGMVGNILVWCEGLEREIKALNITKGEIYDTIKDSDSLFLNLIKRPPLQTLFATRTASTKPGPNLIGDHSFTFSYRYIYEDGEVSVLAPYTEPVQLTYKGELQETLKEISVSIFTPEIPVLVAKVEFLVKRNQETVWYSIKTIPVTPTAEYSFRFDNSFIGSAIGEDDALRQYDAIWPAKALTFARNRLFYADYAEGFDGTGDANLSISLQSAPPTAGQRIFKSNTSTRFGIVYYDDYGRNMGVITKPEWQVNTPPTLHKTTTDNYTAALLTVNLSPPDWAKHWRLVRSENAVYSFFLQGFGYRVIEQVIFREGAEHTIMWQSRETYKSVSPSTPSFEPAALKGLYIDISSLIDRNIGYIFEKGDLVNLYYSVHTSTGVQDRYMAGIPVLEQRGGLIRVQDIPELSKYGANLPYYSMDRGIRFEIYRPAIVSESAFKETSHGGRVNGSEAKSFTVWGDVWLMESKAVNSKNFDKWEVGENSGRITWDVADASGQTLAQIGVYYPWLEAMSPWDRFYTQWMQDLGRVSIVLPENLRKRIYKPNYERFSNKYIAGTQINGISSFEGLNEKELPMENGPIQKLRLVSNNQGEGTVLLAIMQNETETQYLGEAQFRDTQGQTTMAISDSVIGSTNTLRGGYGTINPESEAYNNGRSYWWDVNKGEVVRYSQDGLTPLAIRYKMSKFFQEVARKQRLMNGRVKVYGAYDPSIDEYILTFSNVVEDDRILFQGFTIAFSERIQGFSTFYSFQPEYYAKTGTYLTSFKDGKLYLHGTNQRANNFYGDQSTSVVEFVSNALPHTPKVWNSVSVEGERLWLPVRLENDKKQLSYMDKRWFNNREGVFYGAIRRDIHSKGSGSEKNKLNNGSVLRSQTLDITIETDDVEVVRLDCVNVEFQESLGHTTIRG